MNKKMLSAVAASAIALGLIGCGGGSSSSTTTTTTQPTKVKGVDGYVMNAKMSVTYWNAEKNVTQTTNVDVSKSYYLTVDAETNKKRVGEPIYSLADLNSTVLNNVVSVVMSSQAQGKLADGSVYAQSFYDADANGELNTSIDVPIPAGVSLSAPKGYSVVTPISTIIANQVTAELAADKNETNLTNVVDAYTKDVANALGVDATTIKNVDPLTLVNSTDEKAQAYVVANAFAGAIIARGYSPAKLFNSLKSAPAPKTAADVIGNLATAATDAGDRTVAGLLTQVKSLITTDKANLATLVNSNLDKTRTLSVNNGSLQIAALEGTAKDFNMTMQPTAGGGNGYKIATNSLEGLSIRLAPNDQNITNQKFTFVIRVADPKAFNAQDSNVSSLTVKVPFEVNATNGVINAAIPADAKIIYEGMNTAGTKVITGETNSTIFGTDQIISVNPNNNKTTTITINAKKIIDDVDANQTSADKFFGNGLPAKIAELQAGIVTDAAAQVDSYGNYILLPKDSIVSVGGTINETVDSMISFNIPKDLVADMRGGVTRKNADGNASVSIAARAIGSDVVGLNQNGISTLSEVDFNTTVSDANITYQFADSSIDSGFEKNATLGSVEFNDTLGGALSVNHTSLKNISAPAAGKDGIDELNVTVDVSKINALTTAGHPTAMLTFKATDEFGATGSEENATLWFNRPPKLTTNTIYAKLTSDGNITGVYSDSSLKNEINVTGNMGYGVDVNLSKFVTDLDDDNITDVNITAVRNNDVNSSIYTAGTYISTDLNTTASGDTNVSINGAPNATGNVLKNSYLELNVSKRAWNTDSNASIVLKLKMQDYYGASKEENLTIKFVK